MIAELCEVYGWTYSEYMSNPQWFLELIQGKYVRDNKQRELNAKRK